MVASMLAGLLVAAPAAAEESESCEAAERLRVLGAEFQEVACLEDLTTAGTVESGHTDPEHWAGLHAEGTENPTGVAGVQIDGYFPDDSRTNPTGGHDHDSQFVIRLPDEWNGKLVITGAPGNRGQYANDFIISDWVLARGYAFAATDKGNTGPEFYETGENPGDAVAEWHERFEKLARAAKATVAQRYGREPEFTYAAGISNGGYLVRYALENTPELYDGGVDWEGTLFREEGPNLLTYLPQALRSYPEYRDTGDRAAFEAMVGAGFPPESEFLWDLHYEVYWELTQGIYRKEFDPDYEGPEEEYDYFERPPEVREAVERVSLTGDIGRPMITLHGTLDALLPIGLHADEYRRLVEAAGRGDLHAYYVIESGNHVDGFYDEYPGRLRPILPCFRAAFEVLERTVEGGESLPPGGFVPDPGGAAVVDSCALEAAGETPATGGTPLLWALAVVGSAAGAAALVLFNARRRSM
jgi:hypothetical protein